MLSLVAHAGRRGHDVAIAAASGLLQAEVDCPVYPIPVVERRPTRVPGAGLALARAVRHFRPELVHCHNPGMAVLGAVCTLRGRRPRALVTVHGVPEEDYSATARLLRWCGLPAVACGPGVAAALAEEGFAVRATIVNGVAAPPAPSAELGSLRREWRLPDTGPLLVSVGRLVTQKNHALAIQALAGVPGASLVILGTGPLQAELEELARIEGVDGRLALPGTRPDARAIMAGADAVVLPSRWEGLPLVGLEALAAKTPLVATAVRGIREVFRDGVHCMLVEPESEALAAGVRTVLADHRLAERLVTAGAELAASYGEEHMAERFDSFYAEVTTCPG